MRRHRSPDCQHSSRAVRNAPRRSAFKGFHLNSGASNMNSANNDKNQRNLGWLGQGLALMTLSVALAGCGGSSDAGSTAATSSASTGSSGSASATGASTSANGTTASKIVDSAHNVWTIAAGVVYE